MRRTTIALTAAIVLAASGCGSDSPTKAGGDSPPLELTAIATAGPGFPGGDQLSDFARRISDLSDGNITITVLAANSSPQERETVEFVQAGHADIGLVPARIFDTMGVTSLRALQAPFLIDRNAVADAVLADPVADDMLAGLDPAGLTGLALTFDSLRQPIGLPEPLLEPADFDGKVVSVLAGDTQQATYQAFGATITDAVDAELTVGVHEGKILGRDGAVQVPPGGSLGPATGNAILGLKANVIFVDSKKYDGLTSTQQDVLRQAAQETRGQPSSTSRLPKRRRTTAHPATAMWCSPATRNWLL